MGTKALSVFKRNHAERDRCDASDRLSSIGQRIGRCNGFSDDKATCQAEGRHRRTETSL